jgi:hypothetical protein
LRCFRFGEIPSFKIDRRRPSWSTQWRKIDSKNLRSSAFSFSNLDHLSIGPLIADEGQAFFTNLAVHDVGVRPHDSARRAKLAGLRSAANAVAKNGW